ncbi:MAG TPA: phosphotransferase [Bryobacteraceae bacterium]|nr:phosphotransferase [Bryobacteraceae bacterium]
MPPITGRSSQSLDIEDFAALEDYLRRTERVAQDAALSFRKLGGGVSNRVVLAEFSGGASWVLKQSLEKLRVEVDWRCSLDRNHREAIALSLFEKLAPNGSITPLIFEDRENSLLAMKAAPAPHVNWKQSLMEGSLDTSLFDQAGGLLRLIHQRGAVADRADVARFEDRSFFYALRLEPYYLYTASIVEEASRFLQALAAETQSLAVTIVHGDYSPKNMLVHEGRLILLDHEVAHLGDPAFDLGFFLAHVLSKAHHFPERREAFFHAALRFWTSYQDPWDLEARAVRHTLACLLARVAGRSPLEYLSAGERERQQNAVLPLLSAPPRKLSAFLPKFRAAIEA